MPSLPGVAQEIGWVPVITVAVLLEVTVSFVVVVAFAVFVSVEAVAGTVIMMVTVTEAP